MIVMKFGGTSVESAVAIERVTGIVKSRLDRNPIVVVSAMGKTTNRLLTIANLAVSGKREEALRELVSLRDYHLRESGMERTVDEHFQELSELVKGLAVLGELTPRSIDAISSFGERLSSLIVTNFFQHHGLSAAHLDSRKVIVTDHRHTQAAPLLEKSYAKLAAAIPPLAKNHVVVMGGFIAATEDGVTTTLGRGGSDFTASLAGAGIGA
ncbi:MAG: lysine-sensitive aspartokinase 3, partial [Bryobacteraceae bacterium]